MHRGSAHCAMVAYRAFNPLVACSSHARPTSETGHLSRLREGQFFGRVKQRQLENGAHSCWLPSRNITPGVLDRQYGHFAALWWFVGSKPSASQIARMSGSAGTP